MNGTEKEVIDRSEMLARTSWHDKLACRSDFGSVLLLGSQGIRLSAKPGAARTSTFAC
jgi:hypothetical protein